MDGTRQAQRRDARRGPSRRDRHRRHRSRHFRRHAAGHLRSVRDDEGGRRGRRHRAYGRAADRRAARRLRCACARRPAPARVFTIVLPVHPRAARGLTPRDARRCRFRSSSARAVRSGGSCCRGCCEADHDVVAVSREARASASFARLRWIAGDLPNEVPPLPAGATIFSLGPLDAFAEWLAATRLARSRASSRSARAASTRNRIRPTPPSAMLADRLARAEDTLARIADARRAHHRPASDADLWRRTRPQPDADRRVRATLAHLSLRRRRARPAPARARRRSRGRVRRARAARAAAARLRRRRRRAHRVLGRCCAASAHRCRSRRSRCRCRSRSRSRAPASRARSPAFRAASAGALARMREDLVVDDAAAVADFGWSPRAFRPEARDWTPPPLP